MRRRDHECTGVAFRAPLLPFAAVSCLDDAAALRALVAGPLVRAALAYASPDLDAALDGWVADESATPPPGLLGYVARMAGRPVPFGLFAGCAAGTLAGGPAFSLAEPVRVRGRLDVGAADRLVALAATDPVTRDGVTFVPNTTAQVAAERLRLVERETEGTRVRYHPVAVEDDEALRAVLAAARDGARLPDLARGLAGNDVTYDDAYAYLLDLVGAQVLVPDLAVVTGGEPVAVEPVPESVRAAAAGVRARVPGLPSDRCLHIDASRPGTFAPGAAVLAAAYRAVELLHPLYREPVADADLGRFRAAFAARYGRAEAPFLAALDPETGVGFGAPAALAAAGAPLLAGFRPAPSTDGQVWTPVDHHLVDLLSRALRSGAREIVLGPADLGPLRNQRPRPLPDSLALVGTVAATSAEAVAKGDFRLVVREVRGPGGIGLLSRFADLDPGVDALVRAHVAREEALRPDAVFAEVVHLPERRSGNVAARPVLRAYEIPLLAASGVPPERRIAPADLLVSVADDRIVLRSRRLGREVVPRLSAAHDARASALPAYRFLAALADDGVASPLRWSWGQVQSAPYLPRVSVGRLVLARAQWRWFKAELAGLVAARTAAERRTAVARLREEWGVPRWAGLARGEDYEIPLDLDGAAAAALLAREARAAGQLWLRELLPGPDELCLAGPDGAYVHELVLPMVRTAPAPVAPAPPPVATTPFVPGTEWLAVRLRAGVAALDGLLTDVVPWLVAGRDRWSYERVAEPEPYLRVRVRGDAAALLAALRDVTAPLVATGRVADVAVETYRSPGDVAERLAHADSVAALRVVRATGLDARWRAALWGVDRLLSDAGLAGAERRGAIRRARDRLVAAHGDDGARARRHAGRVLRSRRGELAAPEAWLADVLDERSSAVAPLLAGAPAALLDDLCAQHVARLLRAAHDVQHLVVLDLLDRLR